MHDSVDISISPIEPVYVPIAQDVKAQENFKMQIPIKVLDLMIPDNTEYDVVLSFRGPNGN